MAALWGPLTSFTPKTFPRAFPARPVPGPRRRGGDSPSCPTCSRGRHTGEPATPLRATSPRQWVGGRLRGGDTAVVRTASEVAVEDTGLGPQGLQPGAAQDPSRGGRQEAGRGLPRGPCHQHSAVTLVLGGCPPGPALPRPLTVVGRGKGWGSGQRPGHSGSTSETMSSSRASVSPSAGWGW